MRRQYLSIDPRTLGLWRVAIATLLLLDLVKRSALISAFYTNTSLIPNHRVLWRPPHEHLLSYLFTFTERGQVQVVFVLIGVVYVCLLVGYRTRVMQVLSFLSLVSLHVRADLLVNGGDFVFSDLVLWSAFLPLGQRLSLDSALRRLRGSPSEPPLPASSEPIVSLAVLAATVQLSAIYFFNAVQKTGPTWHSGHAVYYMLHQERIVTALGLWARETLPLWTFRGMSYGALVIEGALPFLILSPWGRPWTRRLALLLITSLHGNIALLSNLGVFSPVMVVFSLMLISARDWEALDAWTAARPRLRRPLDTAVSFGWRVARALASCSGAPPLSDAAPPPAARIARRARTIVREAAVAWLVIVATSQLIIENAAVPRWLQHEQTRTIRATVEYLRLNQGWAMFAPDAPRQDMWIVVDAVTSDGRHIDPYNERASRLADPSLRTIPPRLDQSAAWCDFTVRLPDAGLFHDTFRDWLLNYHQPTRRPEDRIVRFDAYIIRQDSPRPGETEPRNVTAHVFLRH